jgi:hypothetical protein
LTPEEAEAHPQRNILTRALGIDHQVSIDAWYERPLVGDRWVLCSDGLFNEVSDDQIAAVLRRLDDPTEAASELVRLANESGGRDNITVLIVDVVEQEGHAAIAPNPARDGNGAAAAPPAAVGVVDLDDGGRRRRRDRAPKGASVRSRFTWRVALFVLALLVLVGAVIAAFVAFGGDDDPEAPPTTVTTEAPATTSTVTTSTVAVTTTIVVPPTATLPPPATTG